jgi:SAM-dependent methyltransferase
MTSVRADWFSDFFEGMAAELWVAAIPPETTAAEVDLIEAELGLGEGARVLDVPVGHGRHAVELARRGHRVSGVDISPELLGHARAAASEAGVELDLHQGEMRELPWEGAFDGAYCFGNSLGYLDHDGTVAFLTAVGRALRRGGRFALESGVVAESVLPALEAKDEHVIDGITMTVEHRYDAPASRMDTRYRFEREGRVEERDMHYWIFTAAEVQRMLAAAGLRTVRAYGGPDRAAYELGSPRLILVAERP